MHDQRRDAGGRSARFRAMVILVGIVGIATTIMALVGRKRSEYGQERILYIRDTGTSRDLYCMNCDGSGRLRLTSGMIVMEAHANRRAEKIVFSSNIGRRGMGCKLFTANADGSSVKEIAAELDQLAVDPVWSPDGRHIAFSSKRDGYQAIHMVDADGKNGRKLSRGLGQDMNPVWSPDGERIAFTRVDIRATGAYQYFASSVWAVDVKDGQEVELVKTAALNELPAWSPDGRRIAFLSTTGDRGFYNIHVMDADGKNQRRLTDEGTRRARPVWSPDSSRIAFSGDSNIKEGLFIVDAISGKVQTVVSGYWVGRVLWMPGGDMIGFTAMNGGDYSIMLVNVSDQRQQQVCGSKELVSVVDVLVGVLARGMHEPRPGP